MNTKHKLLSVSGILAALVGGWAALQPGTPVRADGFTSQQDLLPQPAQVHEDPPLPELTGADKAYLVKLARKALEYSAQTDKAYKPTDVPDSLKDKDYVAYVSVRQVGHLLEFCAGAGKSLVENITSAALYVASSTEVGKTGGERIATIPTCAIELNILGPGQQLPYEQLGEVARAIIPGVHGIAVRVTDMAQHPPAIRTIRMRESVAPTKNYTAESMLEELLKNAGWTVDQVVQNRKKMGIVFFRYRACHLLEQPDPAGYVELFRCAQLITSDQVTAPRLAELTDLIGQYLAYRQRDTGLFSYNYSPAEGLYEPKDNAVRQAGAAWAMARWAQRTNKPAYELAAYRAIAAAKLRYLDEPKKAVACVGYDFEPGKESLGATALLLCALIDVPNNQPVAALRDKVAAGVLAQQQDDGSFKLFYYDNTSEQDKFYYPGEALLALMKMYQQTGQKKYLDAVEKSFTFYHDLFQKERNQSFVAWQAQVWAAAYDATGKKEYRDFVLQMGDYLVTFQADELAEVYPDLIGAFVSEDGFGSIGSAAFLEGMVAAHRLAVKAGTSKQIKNYTTALRLGARFLDQLTFKKTEAFYCVAPKDVIGGLKTTPVDHSIRIDNCQHGLLALLGIADELFGKKEAADKPK